jgi:glycosyltransferase involved in cell wall biosynthesis
VKVSIITAVFNNQEFIEEFIKSVLSQTYPDIEHIVIDGGSTDGMVKVINKYEEQK